MEDRPPQRIPECRHIGSAICSEESAAASGDRDIWFACQPCGDRPEPGFVARRRRCGRHWIEPECLASVTIAALRYNNLRALLMFWVLRLDSAHFVVVCCARPKSALSSPRAFPNRCGGHRKLRRSTRSEILSDAGPGRASHRGPSQDGLAEESELTKARISEKCKPVSRTRRQGPLMLLVALDISREEHAACHPAASGLPARLLEKLAAPRGPTCRKPRKRDSKPC